MANKKTRTQAPDGGVYDAVTDMGKPQPDQPSLHQTPHEKTQVGADVRGGAPAAGRRRAAA